MIVGDKIYAATVQATRIKDKHGNLWQYNSRSDAHSKAACWAVLFDVLNNCSLLRKHVTNGTVGFGINHTMHDFTNSRKKNLDLVVCTPSGKPAGLTFASLAQRYGVVLSASQRASLANLPVFRRCEVGNALIALEAKACMTAHQKAEPRLYDELASSHSTIHGDSSNAIAAGLVTINISPTFVSSVENSFNLAQQPAMVAENPQPKAAKGAYFKASQLPTRSSPADNGFDALVVVLFDFVNNHGPVALRDGFSDGTGVNPTHTYKKMIERITHIYATRFAAL